ncbi:MAG TPA: protein kinase [Candidatus Sulfotelmatobacter sp.]|nr:protein kinase [Candidatus Sulfotelmatobacter sp.]
MTGQLVGHYRILEKIGSGGMGEVFRARDERLGRDVALKLIRPASSENPDHLRRFEQEARAAAALNHPNILAIYDVGFDGTTPYIVSELLEGKTVRQRLAEGPVPVREASDYALQIAHGLAAAHERRIVHRDLKPENLFLTHDGRVKILDFGVAKLQAPADESRSIESLTTVTKSGAVIGTVAYMSPEQLRGKPVDHRSDIFTFGAILYEMLSGSRAFRGETEVDTMTAVLREEPAEADLEQTAIPQGYKDVVKHCLEKEPENRFQSAKDLAFALQTLTGSSSGNANAVPRPKLRGGRVLPWTLVAALAAVASYIAIPQFHPQAEAPSYQRLTFEAGTVYAARFAPDGPIVYSAAWNDKPVQIFSTIGNSRQVQSLNLSDADLLAISPSNELAIALHGTHNGQLETVGGMLAEAPLAGGSPKELQPDVRWADWDGSGKLAVVHDYEGHSRLEYPIGKVLYQSSGWISHIRFSPQADKIAFMDHPTFYDSGGFLRIVDWSGHVQTLSQHWESEQGVAWRHDGNEIWFAASQTGKTQNLMAVTLSGKVRILLNLPLPITLLDVAADGRVLFTLNSRRLAMGFTEAVSKEDKDLSWHDWNVAKDISPDGKSVLFEDSSEAASAGYVVALRKLDGTLPVRLGEGSAGGLSPDGRWAVAISSGEPEHVILLPIGAGQPRSLTLRGLEHIHSGWGRFLPNSQGITVNANAAGHASRCYFLDIAGSDPKGVTPEGVECGPTSPDSRFLVGMRTNAAPVIYSLEDGHERLVPGLGADLRPVQWSSNGLFLYAYRTGELPSRIYRIEIATGKQTVIQELRPREPAGIVMVAPVVVNRDGTRIAYSYNQTMSTLYVMSGLK